MNPVTDPARICKVMKHPAIWPHVSDDSTPPNWQPAPSAGRVYLMPDDDAACFVFSHHSGALAEGHLAVLPEHRSRGVALANEALQWMRDNTPIRSVMGLVNAENEAARRYVERVGFVAKTQIPNAALKGGRHMDVVFYMKEL